MEFWVGHRTLLFNLSHSMTKQTKWLVSPAKPRISLGIYTVWSEASLSAWRNIGSLAIHWVHSEDSDQSGRIPRLNWVFTGRTCHLLVWSCCGSFVSLFNNPEIKEPRHGKITKRVCAQRRTQAFFMRTEKTLIRLGGCPGWCESSLGAQPHC